MKIGVISDTHLHTVSDGLKNIVEGHFRDADLILHAGDIVSGQVLEYLAAHGAVAVRGNMDHAEVVQSLPITRVVRAGDKRIGLIHGFGAPRGMAEQLRREFDQIDCLVFGHSHQACNRSVGGELWFNPGSAGHGDRGGTFGLLHVGEAITGEVITLK